MVVIDQARLQPMRGRRLADIEGGAPLAAMDILIGVERSQRRHCCQIAETRAGELELCTRRGMLDET